MTTVAITNPWTGAAVERDVSDVTQAQAEAWAAVMDEADLHALEGAESPAAWTVAMVDRLGAERAGTIILGS
jgi:hypothetical protein